MAIGLSPIKPRKLTKKDIYPTVNEKIEQNDEKVSDKEEEEEKDESPVVTKQTVQTNSTLKMSDEEEKLSMDHFKRKLIPASPFSRDLKSIL